MEFIETNLKGCFLIKPKVFQDKRGFFLESYSEKNFFEAGLVARFVQDNHSFSSVKGVVRGLHFQVQPHTQTKLVRVTRGAVYDVAVDLRKDSPTFGKWEGFELGAENFQMLYIPQGFAHGFCTLTDDVEFMYKNDNFYAAYHEGGIRWNDPSLAIPWPFENPVLSDKDTKLPLFKDFVSPF
jgi:dTDP-4-dehydrorhamnose 3,5-epimerase